MNLCNPSKPGTARVSGLLEEIYRPQLLYFTVTEVLAGEEASLAEIQQRAWDRGNLGSELASFLHLVKLNNTVSFTAGTKRQTSLQCVLCFLLETQLSSTGRHVTPWLRDAKFQLQDALLAVLSDSKSVFTMTCFVLTHIRVFFISSNKFNSFNFLHLRLFH